jgi:hypothetical protein
MNKQAAEMPNKVTDQKYIELAKFRYVNDSLKINDDAVISRSPHKGGAYVQSWVWVTDPMSEPTEEASMSDKKSLLNWLYLAFATILGFGGLYVVMNVPHFFENKTLDTLAVSLNILFTTFSLVVFIPWRMKIATGSRFIWERE